MRAVNIVVTVAKLIQNALPLPDFSSESQVVAWLDRIKGPLATLIVLLVTSSGSGPVSLASVPLGTLADRLEEDGIDPEIAQLAVQIVALLSEMESTN